MPDDKQGDPRNTANPASFMQDQMKLYAGWVNSYQELVRSAMGGMQPAQLGGQQWERQQEYLKALNEASQMVVRATLEFMQKSVAQSASGLQQAAQATTEETLQQQEKVRRKVFASS